jgi:hypothetical protein
VDERLGARVDLGAEAFPISRRNPMDNDTPTRCTWLAMTYMDATGTVRIVEIPMGNQISVMIEDIYAATCSDVEVDLVSIPIKALPTMFNQGVKVTIEAHNSSRSDGVLLRAYGRG